jgi:hypothetical protein
MKGRIVKLLYLSAALLVATKELRRIGYIEILKYLQTNFLSFALNTIQGASISNIVGKVLSNKSYCTRHGFD